jgi:hypothetical protein
MRSRFPYRHSSASRPSADPSRIAPRLGSHPTAQIAPSEKASKAQLFCFDSRVTAFFRFFGLGMGEVGQRFWTPPGPAAISTSSVG